jgi:hypothetical protein
MEFETWKYSNADIGIRINKISTLFSNEAIFEGNQTKGSITFISEKKTDDVWGPEAKMSVSWDNVDRVVYHHGKKVNETIRMFSSIEVVATKKMTDWHLSHELTYWFGTRQQMIRKGFYPSAIIHGVMYCETSGRLFEFHASALSNYYKNYEKAFMDIMSSLACHE